MSLQDQVSQVFYPALRVCSGSPLPKNNSKLFSWVCWEITVSVSSPKKNWID